MSFRHGLTNHEFVWGYSESVWGSSVWEHSVQFQYWCKMEEDRVANQRSAFSLSFTLALYISNGFGLRICQKIVSIEMGSSVTLLKLIKWKSDIQFIYPFISFVANAESRINWRTFWMPRIYPRGLSIIWTSIQNCVWSHFIIQAISNGRWNRKTLNMKTSWFRTKSPTPNIWIFCLDPGGNFILKLNSWQSYR